MAYEDPYKRINQLERLLNESYDLLVESVSDEAQESLCKRIDWIFGEHSGPYEGS